MEKFIKKLSKLYKKINKIDKEIKSINNLIKSSMDVKVEDNINKFTLLIKPPSIKNKEEKEIIASGPREIKTDIGIIGDTSNIPPEILSMLGGLQQKLSGKVSNIENEVEKVNNNIVETSLTPRILNSILIMLLKEKNEIKNSLILEATAIVKQMSNIDNKTL